MTVHQIPDGDRGRLPNTAERYNALPDKTRKFFESLQDKDVTNLEGVTEIMRQKGGYAAIQRAVDLADRFNTAGRVTRWALASLAAVVMGTAGLITAVKGIVEFLHPGGGPR